MAVCSAVIGDVSVSINNSKSLPSGSLLIYLEIQCDILLDFIKKMSRLSLKELNFLLKLYLYIFF